MLVQNVQALMEKMQEVLDEDQEAELWDQKVGALRQLLLFLETELAVWHADHAEQHMDL